MQRFYLCSVICLATVAACAQVAGIEDARPGWTTGTGSTSTSSGTSSSGGGMGGSTPCTPGTTQSCYTGPAGTENVGICKAGTQTCKPDGSGYGECVGQVTPQPENCATPSDEDCDGAAPPCQGALLWAKRFGEAGGAVVTTDTKSNVIVTGSFSGDLNFGGSVLSSAGTSDIFLAKLGPMGAHIWSHGYGDALNQTASSVTADAADNVVFGGTFSGTLDFGNKSLTKGGAFVAKLSPLGDHLWSRDFGTGWTNAVAVDVAGNVFVAGYFSGTLSLTDGDAGTGTFTAMAETDMFLAKFDGSGNYLWGQRFGEVGEHYATSVAVDGDGNVFVTGFFSGTLDIAGNTFTGSGRPFIAKFDANGNHQWSMSFTGTGMSNGVASDAVGNAVVVGEFSQTIDLGGTMLTSAGGSDIFLGKLSDSGSGMWAKRFGDADISQSGQGVAVGKSGNIVVGGRFAGSADFGGGALASAGGSDAFLAKFDPAGKHQWSKRFGDSLNQQAYSVALDPGDGALVTGTFEGTMDLGGGATLTAIGSQDLFLAKFAP